MGNSVNVTAAKAENVSGPIYFAPHGTTLPTSVSATLATAFKSLGFVGEEGVENGMTIDSERLKEWNGGTVLNMKTGHAETVGFTLLESINTDVLKFLYGNDNVSVSQTTGEISVADKGANDTLFSVVVDTILKDGRAQRLVYPCATITSLANIVYRKNEAVKYGITLGLDVDTSGAYQHKYIGAAPTADTEED